MFKAHNCPFCGHQVVVNVVPGESGDLYTLNLVVKCTVCGAKMTELMTNYPASYSSVYDANDVVDRISDLVDKWNIREVE